MTEIYVAYVKAGSYDTEFQVNVYCGLNFESAKTKLFEYAVKNPICNDNGYGYVEIWINEKLEQSIEFEF